MIYIVITKGPLAEYDLVPICGDEAIVVTWKIQRLSLSWWKCYDFSFVVKSPANLLPFRPWCRGKCTNFSESAMKLDLCIFFSSLMSQTSFLLMQVRSHTYSYNGPLRTCWSGKGSESGAACKARGRNTTCTATTSSNTSSLDWVAIKCTGLMIFTSYENLLQGRSRAQVDDIRECDAHVENGAVLVVGVQKSKSSRCF